ncbi:MAG: PQQ-dependent sugar dehydrogenase [Chloroflexi bacterium]|nr:PQQ-dependent sugar dehydrogenase [Chloroflexota bacterium]MCI0578368.1 PQQ-dependent sugar dehydrogenase [Chloroflexota bacterium]MCI0646229.1 PQQ-dependent sugar dehydrogenase [Chloroflexota bacterium]MCI0732151.1 PQQ-dependent sugar dehydrogenase [Chloroflexota bacterium]
MHRRLPLTLILLFLLAGCDTEEPTATFPPPQPTDVSEETATPLATEPTTPTLAATEPPTEEPTKASTDTPEVTMTPAAGTTDAVGLELVAEGFTSPVALVSPPDDSGRLFVVDQIGLIHVIAEDGTLLEEPFLDLQASIVTLETEFDERGLLGLAFHPDYAENGRFFVYYSAPLRPEAPQDWDHTSHISELTVSADNPDVADPDSERILLQVDEPQFNHNAGGILFGPDGFLYIPLGDGGAANDNELGHVEDWYDVNEGGNGQDLAENLLGSILRIDVDNEGDNGQPYAIPADNPFVGVEGMESTAEVWAYGFRNPFRMSFDRGGDNELFVGDAGQDLWEEVSIVTAGGNYGWNVKEGTHCFSTANPGESLDECPDTTPDGEPLIDPIIEYQNANAPGGLGLVVIGGFIYRGSDLPQFEGLYIFGDWSTSFEQGDGTLLAARPPSGTDKMWTMWEVAVASNEGGRLGAFLLAFGEDADGELYVLTTDNTGPTGNTGRVYRIVTAPEQPAGPGAASPTPSPTP